MTSRIEELEQNLRMVEENIRRAAEHARRDPAEITLVAISKTFPVDDIVAVYNLGARHLGENRVEEAGEKIPVINAHLEGKTRITWHMVGHLQHRKIKDAVALFDWIQSVDSARLARRISERAAAMRKRLPVFLEINVSGEESKYGLAAEPRQQLEGALAEILALPDLDVQGLMTMAPVVSDPEQARPYFRKLRMLREELHTRFPQHTFRHLSMGMTDDYAVAITEGATIVRIGRAIFGERACALPNKALST